MIVAIRTLQSGATFIVSQIVMMRVVMEINGPIPPVESVFTVVNGCEVVVFGSVDDAGTCVLMLLTDVKGEKLIVEDSRCDSTFKEFFRHLILYCVLDFKTFAL
uniref:(northern house mosquito) hypothetical protein n=1 Tax=Culex pipiens TaxID=7175 RepID=A0A8D8JJA9_CULPI